MIIEQFLTVTFPQGVNVRVTPDIKSPSIRIIPKNAQFKSAEIFKLADRIWSRTPAGEYICIANGGNYYVDPSTITQPTTPSLDWAISLDQWARQRGYTGPRP